MAQYESDQDRAPLSGWAVGGVAFAASMMLVIGIFQIINGLAAILNDDFFVRVADYSFDLNITAWGWIHLLLGILVLLAGFALFAGRVWAAFVAITLATLSAIANFFFIPYQPFWALLIIALDVWVIWSLTRAGVVRT
jgi:hypothetical protein